MGHGMPGKKGASRIGKELWPKYEEAVNFVRQGAQMTRESDMPSLHRHELETWSKDDGSEARRHYKPE